MSKEAWGLAAASGGAARYRAGRRQSWVWTVSRASGRVGWAMVLRSVLASGLPSLRTSGPSRPELGGYGWREGEVKEEGSGRVGSLWS